jgi:hypothetical protein
LFRFPNDPLARIAGMVCSMCSCDCLLLICASWLLQLICGAGGAYYMMRQMRQALADRRSVVGPENLPAANIDPIAIPRCVEIPPQWAGEGESAPISYEELLRQTSSRYMVTQERSIGLTSITCEHPRLSKRGTNHFAAKVRCESCCQVLANYVYPHTA